MNEITFSFNYPKLYSENNLILNVKLIEVLNVKLENLSKHFLKYDTNDSYKLPVTGNYLMLIFQKNNKDLFTTLRSNINNKEMYYRSKIGDFFEIKIKEVA